MATQTTTVQTEQDRKDCQRIETIERIVELAEQIVREQAQRNG